MAKREEHKNEILENPDALADRFDSAEGWIQRNPKVVIGVAVVLLLIVGGYFGYTYYKQNLDQEAQREMFQAIYYFEADSLDLALNGDGNNLGFLNIIDDYGITDAANLANYYAGTIYLKQGKYELARLYLEDFSAGDILVQARAFSLIGDSYMEEENYNNAASQYEKAADYEANKFFTPTYLMKAALAYEKLNDNERAIKAYQEIIDKYWDSSEVQNAKKFKARLEGNS